MEPSVGTTPQHYILVLSKVALIDKTISPRVIAKTLLDSSVWLFSAAAPHRKRIRAGDKALVYLAGEGERVFVARAEFDEPLREATTCEIDLLRSMGLTWFEYAARLRNVDRLKEEVPIRPLVESLQFIGNKAYYGHYLRQAVALIGREDYNYIVNNSTHQSV